METNPTTETSPTANLQSARMALTAARKVILDASGGLSDGPTRRGMMMARSQIGLILDELALKKEPTDTIVDLLIALSLPQKPNDLESAKKRLAEITLPLSRQESVTMALALALGEIVEWVHDGQEIDLRAAKDALRCYAASGENVQALPLPPSQDSTAEGGDEAAVREQRLVLPGVSILTSDVQQSPSPQSPVLYLERSRGTESGIEVERGYQEAGETRWVKVGSVSPPPTQTPGYPQDSVSAPVKNGAPHASQKPQCLEPNPEPPENGKKQGTCPSVAEVPFVQGREMSLGQDRGSCDRQNDLAHPTAPQTDQPDQREEARGSSGAAPGSAVILQERQSLQPPSHPTPPAQSPLLPYGKASGPPSHLFGSELADGGSVAKCLTPNAPKESLGPPYTGVPDAPRQDGVLRELLHTLGASSEMFEELSLLEKEACERREKQNVQAHPTAPSPDSPPQKEEDRGSSGEAPCSAVISSQSTGGHIPVPSKAPGHDQPLGCLEVPNPPLAPLSVEYRRPRKNGHGDEEGFREGRCIVWPDGEATPILDGMFLPGGDRVYPHQESAGCRGSREDGPHQAQCSNESGSLATGCGTASEDETKPAFLREDAVAQRDHREDTARVSARGVGQSYGEIGLEQNVQHAAAPAGTITNSENNE